MDNQLLTLSKIFSERLFRIPDYQRGYAWGEKQLKDFWNDIQQIRSSGNHYTGVLTLESVQSDIYEQWDDDLWIIEAKSYQPYFIVDGQQRLTTAIVLIQAILERIGEKEKLNFTDKSDIIRKFVFDSKDDGISRSYVFGYEKDNPSYEFLKTKIFNEHSSSNSSQETIYTQNLTYAKQFFINKLIDFSNSELEILYKKITQQLLFNIFTITEDVEVCVAFETMNNRGKPLSYLELLKNRLIYLSLKFDASTHEQKRLRNAINDCWKSIYHNLGRNKERPLDDDRFLSIHYIVYFGKEIHGQVISDENVRFRRIYKEDYTHSLLENHFVSRNISSDAPKDKLITLRDVYKYVSSLQESVQLWYKMWNPFDSEYSTDTKILLDKINRLGSSDFQPLILVALQSKQNEVALVAFLRSVERFLFIDSIYNLRQVRMFFSRLDINEIVFDLMAKKVGLAKITESISAAAVHTINDELVMREIVTELRSEGFYQWRGIRYFLFEYELYLQENAKTDREKLFWPEFTERKADYISVEHIYPKQARHGYWTSRFDKYNQRQRTALRESLGNLLPLSRQKNSSLSNKPFPEKVEGVLNTSVGYRFGCYSENEVASKTEWTAETILERGLQMLSFMEKRWDFKLGTNEVKKAMLGLDFMP
jgi:Protein of unknown function DUF262/Protein of unknown function (DUF1524)